MAAAVPQTLEYRGGQLNVAPVLEVKNFSNWKKRFMVHIVGIEPQFKAKSTWDDMILYNESPSDVKESRVMDLKLCYNTFKFKEGESLTQTFTRYKALINELVNDGINLSKLEINTGLLNEALTTATPLSTAFISTFIIQDFQDSFDDEENTRSSQEYLNDLEEEYQAKALLAKSKRFFKKGSQRFSGVKATEDTQCHKFKNKGLVAEICKWDAKEVSYDEEEMVEVKSVMALIEEYKVSLRKENARNGKWIQISMEKCISEQTPSQKRGLEVEASLASGQKGNALIESSSENSIMPQQNNERTHPSESKINTTNPSIVVLDSSASDYGYADES
ncbi:hypothetical protein Tco_0218571 [Tanacetum coccineum]